MRKAKVIKAHESEYTEPFLAKAGTILIAEAKESEWDGWIWCKSPEDIYKWYPKAYVKKITGKPNYYELTHDYNAKEIQVQIGEEVTIQFEESSWVWVVKQNGEEGWVPLENLEYINQ